MSRALNQVSVLSLTPTPTSTPAPTPARILAPTPALAPILALALTLALGACGVEADEVNVTDSSGETQALKDVIDDLVAVNEAQSLQISDLRAELDALRAEHDTLAATAATESWVNAQGFVGSAELAGYATENWVESRLTDMATQTWVGAQGYETGASVDGKLASYATEEAVSDLGDAVAGLEDEVVGLRSNKVGLIQEDLTLEVPGDYADLNEALRWLDGYAIGSGATVTLHVADGSYVYDREIVVRHANGDRIRILGNESNAGAVTLHFEGSGGIKVENGGRLGYLNGMTLQGDASSDASGLYVTFGSVALVGPRVVVEQFGGTGVVANWNSTLYVQGVKSQDNGDAGFEVLHHSSMSGPSSIAEGNGGNGYYVYGGSFLSLGSASSRYNGGNGVKARADSLITAPSVISSYNSGYGFMAGEDASIDVSDTSPTANSSGSYSPAKNATIPSWMYE